VSVSQPTIVSGATSITLPFPVRSSSTRLDWTQVGSTRRTLDGTLRKQSFGYAWAYTLTFEYAAVTTYDALVSLDQTIVTTSTPATFTFAGGPWIDAQSGVTVVIDQISDLATTYPDVTKGDFSITLVETTLRTS
jgi:hypothetical protein